MPTVGSTSRTAYVYDSGTDTWIPIGPSEHTHSYVLNSLVTAKGDIVSASASGVPSNLPVGSNNNILRVNSSTATGLEWSSSLSGLTLASPIITGTTNIEQILEKATVSGTALGSTANYDLLTNGSVTYITASSANNYTLNIRGNSSTTLNSIMSTGQSLTIALLITNGGTAYYQSGFQIDGSSVTPKWQGGTAISSGNVNSVDIYSITIIKTGDATFTAFAAQTKFA
jgi:hypothetical protein